MVYAIFFTLIGLAILFKGSAIIGAICVIVGVYLINDEISRKKLSRCEIEVSSVDRSEYVIDKIGGFKNIDINLSKYSSDSQLIVLKNKSIIIGYNDFEAKKNINFDSIINVDIRINYGKIESGDKYNRYSRDIIESIFVYIHTNECTEELIFKYSYYRNNEVQIKYNEILNGLNRFKSMIDITLDTNNPGNNYNINYKEKSIPEQVKEYKELLDIGAITESEYENKKMNF